MPVPPKDLVQQLLDKYREPIVAVVRGAWDDWRASPYVWVWRCKRSRANFVWEQIIERAHLAFDSSSGVRIIDGQETYKSLVEDRVLFRFKKGDEAGLTANVPTQLALAFHDHDQRPAGPARGLPRRGCVPAQPAGNRNRRRDRGCARRRRCGLDPQLA